MPQISSQVWKTLPKSPYRLPSSQKGQVFPLYLSLPGCGRHHQVAPIIICGNRGCKRASAHLDRADKSPPQKVCKGSPRARRVRRGGSAAAGPPLSLQCGRRGASECWCGAASPGLYRGGGEAVAFASGRAAREGGRASGEPGSGQRSGAGGVGVISPAAEAAGAASRGPGRRGGAGRGPGPRAALARSLAGALGLWAPAARAPARPPSGAREGGGGGRGRRRAALRA